MKTFVLESLYNKFSGLYLKETSTQVFSCEYCKIFTNTNGFFHRIPPVTLSADLFFLIKIIIWDGFY